jgi:hypothetical protein
MFGLPVKPPNKHGSLEFTEKAIGIIIKTLEQEFPPATVHYIRGDGDRAFGTIVNEPPEEINADVVQPTRVRLGNQWFVSNPFTEYLQAKEIEMYLDSSKFTNKVRSLDRAVRTIRDIVGENRRLLMNTDVMKQALEIYNNTVHSAFGNKFTPKQVQSNPDLEEYFIRDNIERLHEIKALQQDAGFFNYKTGDIILIHLDRSKTTTSMVKKRRAFNEVSIFVQYQNGNVVCQRLRRNGQGGIVLVPRNSEDLGLVMIPIYYTKLVAPTLKDLPKKYQQLII